MDSPSTGSPKSGSCDDTTTGTESKQVPWTSPLPPEPELASGGKSLLTMPASILSLRLAVPIAVVVTPFLFVIVLSVVLGRNSSYQVTKATQDEFCCPNELRTVLRGINPSIDPCEDFYGHVCSRIDAGEVAHVSPLFRVVQKLNLLELETPRISSCAAGEMLAALRRGLWDEALRDSGKHIADYVKAISKALDLAPRMDLARMVRFLAELGLRYGLPSVVSFEVSETGTVMTINRNDGCISREEHDDLLHFALESFNDALKTTVTPSQLLQVEEKLAKPRGRNVSKVVSRPISNSPFSDLPEGAWTAIINDLVLPVHPNAVTFETYKDENFDGLFNALANGTLQPATVAFEVVCSALKTRDLMEAAALKPGAQSLITFCQALDICEIEQAYAAAAFGAHRMNEHVTALFTKIRDNVIQHADAAFDKLSTEDPSQMLRKLRLVLPDEIVVSDIAVPKVRETFADNLIAARLYVFEVRKAKVARNIPSGDNFFLPTIVRNGDVAYVPTNLYAILPQQVQRTVALDVPALGVDIAYHLWSFLLGLSWSPETSRTIGTYKTCFNGSGGFDHLKTAVTALGMVSAIDATMGLDWNVLRTVNGTETSLVRLVYLMWAYDKCAQQPIMGTSVDVNMVVRNSAAFRDAFGCSKSSAMAQKACCLGGC
ncbi:hypothetical protein HPB50_014549 [Hyalomma asiaticum]|uniref:Uncharacterized protein n=1 Tax=Hyalomma asiaticum TaxID=266040 RepID=A0ACB7RNP8_HYAAI|nr:hypothetical protein HPB50_014549 [Hyalomma asiaticum]